MTTKIPARVHSIRATACDVVSLDLRPVESFAFPEFSSGSHIDVEFDDTASGRTLVRQYSLTNDSSERERYLIGVARDPKSRGGSAYIHDHIRVGDVVRISHPRNHFPLDESATQTVFLAGGIGITPILSMIRRLNELRADWTLYYGARSPSRIAYFDELQTLVRESVRSKVKLVTNGIEVNDNDRIDIKSIVEQSQPGTHFYCCGPVQMIEAFRDATSHVPERFLHVESFTPAAPEVIPGDTDGDVGKGKEFIVKLKRRGVSVHVGEEESILDALLKAGVEVDNSCHEGICGTCETKVLDGEPEHLDSILSMKRDPPVDRMMVCVSRCKGPSLTLDL